MVITSFGKVKASMAENPPLVISETHLDSLSEIQTRRCEAVVPAHRGIEWFSYFRTGLDRERLEMRPKTVVGGDSSRVTLLSIRDVVVGEVVLLER